MARLEITLAILKPDLFARNLVREVCKFTNCYQVVIKTCTYY